MYKISISPEEIDRMKPGCFPGKIHVIDKNGLEYFKAVAYLARQDVIGFDTETRPVFTPGAPHHGVALLQLSGADHAYLFRVQKIGLGKLLRKVLSNPHILKIGAASHDDVRGLQKIAPFKESGFVDLQKIAWQWGIRDKSVKKLAGNILRCRISKTQQLSNWEAQTLNPSQQKYAATDAWVCREMYLKLLDSPRRPLSKEQMNPPQPQPQPQCAQPQDAQATPKSQAPAAALHKRRRKPRHRKRPNNGSDNPKEG